MFLQKCSHLSATESEFLVIDFPQSQTAKIKNQNLANYIYIYIYINAFIFLVYTRLWNFKAACTIQALRIGTNTEHTSVGLL